MPGAVAPSSVGMSVLVPPADVVGVPARRRLRAHPRLQPYHRLLAAVLLVNLVVLAAHLGHWRTGDGSALAGMADALLVNLAAAVLIRQQAVLNALFGLAGRGSRAWPLWLRWSVSRVHHVGGIHAGAALAGTAWLIGFAVVATIAPADPTTRILTYALVGLLVAVCACASPRVRARAHNVFENTHR